MLASTRTRLTLLAGGALLVAGAILVAVATSFAFQSFELQTLRNQGKALFEEQRFAEAAATFAQAALDSEATAQDYINLAAAQYRSGDDVAALATLDRFAEALQDNPGAPYLRGLSTRRTGDIEAARAAFEAARALDPTDPAIRYNTGAVYAQIGLQDEAVAEFQVVIDMGFDVAAQHYVSSLYQTLQTLLRQGRRPEAEPLIERYTESNARLTQAERAPGALDLGRWSAITVPTATVQPAAPDTAPQVRLARSGEPTPMAGAGDVAVADLNLDGRQDWMRSGPEGAVWLSVANGHAATPLATAAGPVGVGDYDRDGRPDLYVAATTGDRLYRNVESAAGLSFEPVDVEGLPSGGSPSHVLWVDFDHDGDLDVLVTHGATDGTPGAARLLRNQGSNVFSDVTATAGFESPRADTGALFADFDADFDIDLLFWGAGGTTLFSNQRNGLFEEITAAVGAAVEESVTDVVAEDLDNDGRIDLALATADGIVLRRNLEPGTFRPEAAGELAGIDATALEAADFNNDGYLDLVASVDGALRFWANAGDFSFVSFEPLPTGSLLAANAPMAGGSPSATGSRAATGTPPAGGSQGAAAVSSAAAALLITADVDANGAVDVIVEHDGALSVLEQSAPVTDWLAVDLTGVKNNLQGIGATVEVKAGGSYQLRPLRRPPLHFGVGAADLVEVVRIRWPNGIIQNLLDAPTGEAHGITELERLEGSCPFLYTWDGERFRFVNEVLGSSPLGMLLAEGAYHVPDGDEYVFVSGEHLRPRDGFYELRLTEELRETAYIDAVRVLAVDHPETLSILPDEGFGGLPRPDFRLHLTEKRLPARATDQNGRDWTEALASVDGEWAIPFEPAAYDGLATEHVLTLELPEAGEGTERPEDQTNVGASIAVDAPVQLHLTGWVYWSMGSVNLAVDQDPSAEFTPVSLEVPDGRGGWRTAIDDIGLPIAKNTTLVVDVSDVLERSDPRLRLRTTMRLYWDAAAYTLGGAFAGGVEPVGDWQQAHRVPRPGEMELRGTDGAVAPLRVEVLAPAGAEVRPRGFSAVSRTPEGYETFDYHTVLADAPWEQHRGYFTRFGDVRELVQAADDRYVVIATGDEIALRFAAPERPLPDGWRRDYLVYLNGWLKDTDVNSMYGDRVAPLPFQGMPGYPYPPSVGYPDDEEHRAFLEAYLTRPPRMINPALNR